MAEYQHFLYGTWERPEALWRMAEDRWEWLDREFQWEAIDDDNLAHPLKSGPTPSSMISLTADQAAQLVTDRPRWVLYWVWREVYRPVVCRRGRVFEQEFRDDGWKPSRLVFDSFDPRADPIRLDEIDVETADRIIRETQGISGATAIAQPSWTSADLPRRKERDGD